MAFSLSLFSKQGNKAMKSQRCNSSSQKGFTLIEVVIVIAMLAIVAGAMAPLASRAIDSSRQDLTLKRQQLIYRAIFGDPAAPGSGFLNDIGRIPNSNLSELALIGGLPPYASQSLGVGMGWRGPYLLEGIDASGLPIDGWGTPMDWAGGQIRSAGPDHDINTGADNILYPSIPVSNNNLNGNINLTVLARDTSSGQPLFVPAGGQARIYYPQNGQEQSYLIASPTGLYSCPPAGNTLPQGIHAVWFTADPDGPGPQPALTGTITIYCPGGGTVQQTIALR
jgi:prepilin-type N-terminal cleavage/methylation domain-containing protein